MIQNTVTEIYRLDGNTLPSIPVPHDCIIDSVREDDETLEFIFEEDISKYDAASWYHPDVQTLRIRFHKTEPDACTVFRYSKTIRYEGYGFFRVPSLQQLMRKKKKKSAEYLFHYVAYNSMIVRLSLDQIVLLQIETDRIELIWTLKNNASRDSGN